LYISATQILELEQNTLNYLQNDAAAMDGTLTDDKNEKDMDILKELFSSDKEEMSSELKTQQKRLAKSERDVAEHIFECFKSEE